MTDDLVKRLRDFDPHNMHEWEAVDLAADRIEELERERVLDAKLLADTQALLDTALEAVIDAKLVAEAKVQALEAERDAAIAALAELPEVRALIRQAVDKAVRIVMDEVGYEEEDLCESCRDSLAAIRGDHEQRQ